MRTGPEATIQIIEANFEVDLREHLAGVEVPTVVVHGVLDALSPTALEDAHQLAGEIPGAELYLLDDAGHLPLLSRPSDVADILGALLARTSRHPVGES